MKKKKTIDLTDSQKIVERKEEQGMPAKRPIYIKTLNVFVNPVKARYERHYREKKQHLVMDVLFVVIIVLLLVINGILLFREFAPIDIQVPEHKPVVSGPYLQTDVFVNKTGADFVRPGDFLEYEIVFKNISEYELQDLFLEVGLKSVAIDWSSLQNGGEITGNQIVWTAASNEALRSLEAGGSMSLNFSFKLLNKIGVSNPVISMEPVFKGRVLAREFEQEIPKKQLKVSGDIDLGVSYKYFSDEGEQLGVGAWPVAAGEETTVRVFLQVKNGLNNTKDVVVSAKLPQGVSSGGGEVVDKGSGIVFQDDELVWSVGDLKAGGQANGSFLVEFVPDEVGSGVLLLEDSKIKAIDGFTGAGLADEGKVLMVK